METCKICGVLVQAGQAINGHCLEQLVTEVSEQFCDYYCRWPLTNAELLDDRCRSCPMDRLLNLVKP